MLGFTLPLFIILGAEGLVAVLLLCPKPLNQPAIKLARLTYTQASVGRPLLRALLPCLPWLHPLPSACPPLCAPLLFVPVG